ncbi:MAG: pseudouridine synthase, partial [Opitutales bacterium]
MPNHPPRKSREGIPKGEPDEHPRLQKFIAGAGLCSRRKAEEWIADGRVTVNGERAELGRRVNANADVVRINGRRVKARTGGKVVLVMNKPRGYACTNEDPHADLIVIDLLPKRYAGHRLFCAGRLDKDSEGLLVLTDDGSLAHRLTHPSSEVKKIYSLKLSRPLEPEHVPLLQKGKEVDGEFLRIDKIRSHKSNKE